MGARASRPSVASVGECFAGNFSGGFGQSVECLELSKTPNPSIDRCSAMGVFLEEKLRKVSIRLELLMSNL